MADSSGQCELQPPGTTAGDAGPSFERIATKACSLLSLPAVAMKVLELTESAKVDTRALKQCIETDPALTSKILRVVNSSVYGLSREVSDLNQALALLGTKPLKLLVLGFSLPTGLFDGIMGDLLLRYWRHTLVKAVAAREISETFWKQAGDEPFIAGLLQDLGSLLLMQELGDPYVRFLEQIADHKADAAEFERQALGFEHTQLTARLLRHWRLPPALADVVSLSETPDPDDTRANTTRKILRLAELVAQLLADDRDDALARLVEEGQAACGMTRSALDSLVSGLEEKVRQLADTLKVDLSGRTDYRELLLEAHVRLAEVAEDAAGYLAATSANRDTAGESFRDVLTALSDAADRVPQSLTPPAHSVPRPPSSPPSTDSPVSAPRLKPTAAPVVAPARLAAYVAAAAAACRQARCALSLMLVEMNEPETVALTLGQQGFLLLRSRIEQICRSVDHAQRACLPYGEVGFIVILSDCERQSAVHHGQALIRSIREQFAGSGATPAVTVSVGVASVSLPAVNFDAPSMLESADRCLYGARSSGGAMVKSIEIY